MKKPPLSPLPPKASSKKPPAQLAQQFNPEQRRAVEHGVGPPRLGVGAPLAGVAGTRPAASKTAPNIGPPLLIVAGAGTGKTNTLARRGAHLIANGTDPNRILMLTFTRQASQEMQARIKGIIEVQQIETGKGGAIRLHWAGTFHSVGQRLLRIHGKQVGLDPNFTIKDREDSEDIMDMVRGDLELAAKNKAFPKKERCLTIYSRLVNAQQKLKAVLEQHFDWAVELEGELRKLFAGYVAAKLKQNVLDYDDLLLFWHEMLKDPGMARAIGGRFDHILVDEFQDTNVLQASILRRMKPDGMGVTVVGDEAQSIYGFRAAEVRNILDFPKQFKPPATVIKLEQNYRSTAPILEASNAVINLAKEGFAKKLTATREGGKKPRLVTVTDEPTQAAFVAEEISNLREKGRKLKSIAVLFRSTHHSAMLQMELGRLGIPFQLFGGQKFTEAAHIKDVLGVLAWADNPADRMAGLRILKLLPGIGHTTAAKVLDAVEAASDPMQVLTAFEPPKAATEAWPAFTKLMRRLHRDKAGWPAEVEAVLTWYRPIMQETHDDHRDRLADLDQLQTMAGTFKSRRKFLTDLSLDPPSQRRKAGRAPQEHDDDGDVLTLSTIHSCKGREWRTVFVLSVTEGCLPSSRAKNDAEVEEERRLLYVAMTRAKTDLTLMTPWRVRVPGHTDHGFGGDGTVARSGFIPDSILGRFERVAWRSGDEPSDDLVGGAGQFDLPSRIKNDWKF